MTDLEIIRQIEKELNVKLKKSDEIEWKSRSYTLNQEGQVIGIELCSCEIENLNRIISLLSALTNLTQLSLRDNQLIDISPLSALTNLTQLSLSNNQVSDISPISALMNLMELDLRDNQVSDISPISALMNLMELDLRDNQVSDISPISALMNLTRLSLISNQVSDISPLMNLKNLNVLWLQNNPIEILSSWITEFDMNIQWKEYGYDNRFIIFYNNPLKTPPPEIVKQGKEAVRNYFEQLKTQEEDYIFEAKLLIIGEAGAGKTSMAWKIEDAECTLPKEEDTTKGIDVRQYYFPLQKEDFKSFRHPEKLENRKFRLNIWDFGGQEIYKATHRFFLSKRSLYALVADSRNEDTDFNYWLHITEMFGGDSPLLIVLNEKQQRKRNLDISAMRNRFTNISEVIDVDFAEDDKTRLNRLERAIRYYVSQLPHIGSPVPSKWTVIREVLENDTRNTLSLQDYLKICQDNSISKLEDTLVLSQYFHDIGVFLHFQEDELLEKTVFLKPDWATHAVYKILDDPLLNRQNGRFNKNDAKKIWHEDEYSLLRFELLRLMQKFFLTYEIGNSGEYIVPERLPAAKPDYSWNETGNLFFQYEYDHFMPRGIMSQFIVQMHRYICNHNLVWRRGVILERENTSAEIVESYDSRVISIRISGKSRRDFMTVITEQMDKINAQYEKMKVEKLIPCNCGECRISRNPHFYRFDTLRRFSDKGQPIQCQNSFEMVNVRSLIDEVFNESMQGRYEEENICQPQKAKRDTIFIKVIPRKK